MAIRTTSALGFVFALALGGVAAAQQTPPPAPPPSPKCTLTPAQIAAGRAVAIKFHRVSGDERVALADPSYIQHNPGFKKRAEENKRSDYEEFKAAFSSAAMAAMGRGALFGEPSQGAPGGPKPPEGNIFEIVTTECDITTIIHKTYRTDPAAPGKFYAAYSFDAFRVKNGKLVEHWDGAGIEMPPAPGAAGAPPPAGAPRP